MKISESKTDRILVKAQIQSEWDNCNCAVVQVTEYGLKQLKEWDRIATEISKSVDSYAHLAIYDYAEFLYMTDTDGSWNTIENIADQLPEKGWMYIKDGELDDISVPEQSLDTHMIKLYGDGKVCWIAYGKHTGEELWTDTIDINEL